jgi:hypothetical protein
MFIWVNLLVTSIFDYILTVAVCHWYFTSNQDTRGHFEFGKGIAWALRYNFGSLAMGSLLLSLSKAI